MTPAGPGHRAVAAGALHRGFVGDQSRLRGDDPLHVARHAGFTGSKILYRYVDESLRNNPARGLLDPAD